LIEFFTAAIEQVDHRPREQHRVHAVEEAAVPGDEVPRVLDVDAALDGR